MKSKFGYFIIVFLIFGCATTMSQTDWYRSCRIRVSVQDGKLNGPFEFYDPKGQIRCRGNFLDDKKEGVWTVWESTGVKLAEISYKNDLKNGPVKLWYGSYIDSGKNAGHLKLQASFLNGEYHGKYELFLSDGEKIIEVELNHGEIVKAHLYYEKAK